MSPRARACAITFVLCGAAADSSVAAVSRPFTWRADLTTGAGLVGVVLIGLTYAWLQRIETVRAQRPARPPRPGELIWAALTCAVVIFELVTYFQTPRSAHPTISSLLDVLTGHEVLRGLVFSIWLAAGWWLWRLP